jgi:hypothetical protein
MRKFRTVFAISALAAIALLVPSTSAQAAPADKAGAGHSVAQLAYGWTM